MNTAITASEKLIYKGGTEVASSWNPLTIMKKKLYSESYFTKALNSAVQMIFKVS